MTESEQGTGQDQRQQPPEPPAAEPPPPEPPPKRPASFETETIILDQ